MIQFEKESAKKTQMAQQADEVYKKKVEETNSFMETYYTELMPRILNVSITYHNCIQFYTGV